MAPTSNKRPPNPPSAYHKGGPLRVRTTCLVCPDLKLWSYEHFSRARYRAMLIKIAPDLMPWRDSSPQRRGPNRRVQTAIVVVVLLLYWLWTLPRAFPGDRHRPSSSASSAHSSSPYAFVTLFAQHPKLDNQVVPDDQDEYFVGVRSLVYQLLHAPKTRTNTSIPFVVLATTDIPEHKLERLRKDGAQILHAFGAGLYRGSESCVSS